MKEHALLFGKDRSQVGIITENPANTSNRELPGVLLLNAGLIHRIGPNRLYVKLARNLASKGFVTMRFDFSGVGDSGPRLDKLPYNKSIFEEVGQAIQCLEDQMGIKRFVLIGLCAGASAAAQVAPHDGKVIGVSLINTLVPRTQKAAEISDSNYYWKSAVFKPGSWLKLILMKASYRSIFKAVGLKFKGLFFPASGVSGESDEIATMVKNSFRSFKERGVKILVVSSASVFDIGDRYIREVLGKDYGRLQAAGLLRDEFMPNTDHNVTPLTSQTKLIEIISGWMSQNFLNHTQ
jgi:pimeloyl-ACP methyl ester carboxylesterase